MEAPGARARTETHARRRTHEGEAQGRGAYILNLSKRRHLAEAGTEGGLAKEAEARLRVVHVDVQVGRCHELARRARRGKPRIAATMCIFAPPTAHHTSQGVERFDQIGYTGTMRGPSRPKGHVMVGQGHRHHPASAPVGKRSGYKSTRTKLVEILQKH